MNNLLKPLTIILAMTIPAIATADINSTDISENEVKIIYNVGEASTNYGRIELERKIRRAAEKVCGPRDLNRADSIGQAVKNRDCYHKAVAKALSSVEASA